MTRKKNGFLTFIFSLIPGAGEMYMGFFKQGISIMCVFFGLGAMSSYLMMGPLLFLMPVIWFYSFFHVHNLASLSDEEFYATEDKFLFNFDKDFPKKQLENGKSRKILAIILILWGSFALWDVFMEYISRMLEVLGRDFEWIYEIVNDIPRFILSVAIILVGTYLIKGKKKELTQIEENTDSEGKQ